MFAEIALEIEERKIRDFGSFLKGNDYEDKDRISKANFYQVLKRLFDELLGEGDIMDLIHYFDPKGSGEIDILRVTAEINERITDQDYLIKLESKIDEVVEGNIFD